MGMIDSIESSKGGGSVTVAGRVGVGLARILDSNSSVNTRTGQRADNIFYNFFNFSISWAKLAGAAS